jgi:hypothetical protein
MGCSISKGTVKPSNFRLRHGKNGHTVQTSWGNGGWGIFPQYRAGSFAVWASHTILVPEPAVKITATVFYDNNVVGFVNGRSAIYISDHRATLWLR